MVKNKQIDTGNVNEPNVDQKKRSNRNSQKSRPKRVRHKNNKINLKKVDCDTNSMSSQSSMGQRVNDSNVYVLKGAKTQ